VTPPTQTPPADPDASVAVQDTEAGRLLWHCRRGMKELDVLLERFAHRALPRASAEERRLFARLLALPDPLLAAYLLNDVPPAEPDLALLAGRIRRIMSIG
jgi:antitoxin CptB